MDTLKYLISEYIKYGLESWRKMMDFLHIYLD